MKKIFRILLRALFQTAFRIRANGLQRPIDSHKLLVIANHASFLDGLLLGLFLPFDPVFVVNTDIAKHWFFKRILSLSVYLCVDPTNPMAIKTIINLVNRGRPVVIFPEGRLTVTGSLMKIYEGPAFVAAKTGATVLPIRLDGTVRTYFTRVKKAHPRRFLPRITITALEPTTIPMPSAGSNKQKRRAVGESMRKLMQQMTFESQPKHTLYRALIDAIDVYGSRTLVAEDVKQSSYTYHDVLKMTLGLGKLICKHSTPGEHIGILMPNLVASVAMLIGTSAHGRIPAMLNYKAGAAGMKDACLVANIDTIITSRAFVQQAQLEVDVAQLQGINVLYLEDLRGELTLADKVSVAVGMIFPQWAIQPANPRDTAVVLFTSGSEGKPKGVVLSHYALLSNVAQLSAIIDFSREDTVLNALPIFHSFGLTAGTLLPLLKGMKLFLYTTPLHYRIIPELVYDRNCTVLFGTSTFLGQYAKHAHPYDFNRLRYVVSGAEKLSNEIRDAWFNKFGIRILEGYGATETAPVLSVNTPMAYQAGSVGQLLPSVEYKLIPVSGIAQGGMLHVRGPNLMSGYYRHEAPGLLQPPSSEAGEGWYETGDVASIDQEGFVSIIGRVKRFAKIAGEMVSLEVVESIAAHALPDAQHAASSRPDGAKGEAIVLFTNAQHLTRDALVATAKRLGLPEIAVPRHIQQVATLPLLGTGKTDYVTLKQMAQHI